MAYWKTEIQYCSPLIFWQLRRKTHHKVLALNGSQILRKLLHVQKLYFTTYLHALQWSTNSRPIWHYSVFSVILKFMFFWYFSHGLITQYYWIPEANLIGRSAVPNVWLSFVVGKKARTIDVFTEEISSLFYQLGLP